MNNILNSIKQANALEKSGQYADAARIFESAVKNINKDEYLKEYLFCVNSLGACYFALKNYSSAIVNFDLAAIHLENNNMRQEYFDAKMLSALCHRYNDRSLTGILFAANNMSELADKCSEENFYETAAWCDYYCGEMYFSLTGYNHAIDYLEKSVQLFKKDSSLDLGIALSLLGWVYFLAGNPITSLSIIEKHFLHIRDTNYDRSFGQSYLLFAIIISIIPDIMPLMQIYICRICGIAPLPELFLEHAESVSKCNDFSESLALCYLAGFLIFKNSDPQKAEIYSRKFLDIYDDNFLEHPFICKYISLIHYPASMESSTG